MMPRAAALVSALALLMLGVLGRSSAQEASPGASPAASPGGLQALTATLRDVNGQEVGLATFGETLEGQVSIGVSVRGLTPGEHGIHLHETGVCDPTGEKPFTSAGGHYNPTGAKHGAPSGATGSIPLGTPEGVGTPGVMPSHAGDLGNILVDAAGTGQLQITTGQLTLAELSDTDGSALVIHADRDDLVTDPAGNSGGRIVCGVIAAPMGGGTPTAGEATAEASPV